MHSTATLVAYAVTTCDYCHAQPGERCRVAKGTTKGRAAPWPHAGRARLLAELYSAGYLTGNVDALAHVLYLIDNAGVGPRAIPAGNYTSLRATVEDTRATYARWLADREAELADALARSAAPRARR